MLIFGNVLAVTDPNFIQGALLFTFKTMFIISIILYLIFAIVIVRQINVMKKTLITPFSPVVKTIGWIHLMITVGVLLLYLIIL
jgi:choline-glycine betaine transporter